MSMEEFELVFVPGPGIGHIVSAIEVGKRILDEDSRLSITFLLINDPMVREYTNSRRFHSHPRLRLLNLPEIGEVRSPSSGSSDSSRESERPGEKAIKQVNPQKPLVREAVIGRIATGARVVGLVADMLCMIMTEVADEFSIPAYVYSASGAGLLALMLQMRRLTDEAGVDITEFENSGDEISVAGFANPVPARVLPAVMVDKKGGAVSIMTATRRIWKSRGIFINTFEELETDIIESLLNPIDARIPPVYAVGPILNLETPPESEYSDVLTWLDQQPQNSVLFLCFGSLGSFSDAQVKQIAAALELTGRRFLWSLRRVKGNLSDSLSLAEILPQGFLRRTEAVGKVIGWAPQAAVLAHPAVGGFVSHCGWNSVLESMWNGVPMAAWPLYAEQQLNAFHVVAETGVAVEVRVDYRWDCRVVVPAEEIAAAIERLMEEGSAVRERAAAMREKSATAVADGGSSRKFLAGLVRDIIKNSSC